VVHAIVIAIDLVLFSVAVLGLGSWMLGNWETGDLGAESWPTSYCVWQIVCDKANYIMSL